MHIKDLPATQLVETVWDSRLRTALTYAMDGKKDVLFTHFTTISGAPRSGRLLLTQHAFDAVAMPSKTRAQMCEVLQEWLQHEARFDPHPPPVLVCRKAFEVHSVLIRGVYAALIWAVWLPEEDSA
jgi:hypothetical protein